MDKQPYQLALIFTGHMIDLPGRSVPRFPAELESAAARKIAIAVRAAMDEAGGSLIGIASGARGGDILFLEACAKEAVPTRMVLPKPPQAFVASSVAGLPDSDWEQRFDALWAAHGPDSKIVIAGPGTAANIYDACNQQMLALARQLAPKLRLLALWNGEGGDGPGGTAGFVAQVTASQGMVSRIDAAQLLKRHRAGA